jgi:hypothetical protein
MLEPRGARQKYASLSLGPIQRPLTGYGGPVLLNDDEVTTLLLVAILIVILAMVAV